MKKHNPPHFHVEYGEYKAVIKIMDYALAEGYLPPKALGLVTEWANIHKVELEKNWVLLEAKQTLQKIEPLK